MFWKYREKRSGIMIDSKIHERWKKHCDKKRLILSKEAERLLLKEMRKSSEAENK